jgi:hypothetical protein
VDGVERIGVDMEGGRVYSGGWPRRGVLPVVGGGKEGVMGVMMKDRRKGEPPPSEAEGALVQFDEGDGGKAAALLSGYVQGRGVPEIAKELGLSTRAAWQILGQKSMQRAVREIEARMMVEMGVEGAQEVLDSAAVPAARRLVEHMQQLVDPRISFEATKEVLNRTMGRKGGGEGSPAVMINIASAQELAIGLEEEVVDADYTVGGSGPGEGLEGDGEGAGEERSLLPGEDGSGVQSA